MIKNLTKTKIYLVVAGFLTWAFLNLYQTWLAYSARKGFEKVKKEDEKLQEKQKKARLKAKKHLKKSKEIEKKIEELEKDPDWHLK